MATRTKTVPVAIFKSVSRTPTAQTVFVEAATVFTNETADAASTTASDVVFAGAVADNLYIGDNVQFAGLYIDVSTAPVGGTRDLEYWNGSAWAALSDTYITGNTNLTVDTVVRWAIPSDWATTAVNGVTRYWVRYRVLTLYSTAGNAAQITVAHANRLGGATITAYLPETSGRTIINAWIDIAFSTPLLSQGDMQRFEAKFGAAARGTLAENTTAGALAAPGETMGMRYQISCTSEFDTGLSTGASVACDFWVTILQRGAASANHAFNLSGILWVTYQYDDTASTQLGFAVIPLDSLTGNLAATITTIGGTGGIPNLGSVLPEASKTFRHWGLVFEGNACGNGATDYDFIVQIDSDAEVTLANKDGANNSEDWSRHIHVPASIPSTAAAHDAKARVSSITGARYTNVAVYLIVVYEFDASAANDRWVCLCLPMEAEQSMMIGTATANQKSSFSKKINIQDAGIALQQSGIVVRYHAGGDAGSLVLNVNAQATRTYTVVGLGTGSGPMALSHRIDSGAAAGTGGLTLARGENEIKVEWRFDATQVVSWGASVMLWLNYTADKSTANKTQWVANLIVETPLASTGSNRTTFTYTPVINEASYWLDHVALETNDLNSGTSLAALKLFKGADLGWVSLGSAQAGTISLAFGYRHNHIDLDHIFKRHAGDVDTSRIDYETAQSWACEVAVQHTGIVEHKIYHDFAYSWLADVQNSAGGSVDVDLFESASGELHQQGSRTGNGTVTFTTFDNAIAYFAEGFESTTKKGRTNDESAAGTYTLDLAAPGGGGGGGGIRVAGHGGLAA